MWSYVRALVAAVVLVGSAWCIHLTQLLMLPLWPFLPRRAFRWVIDHTQVGFCEAMVLLHVLLAPGHLEVTGNLDDHVLSLLAATNAARAGGGGSDRPKDKRPERSIMISNHLLLLDWIYLWMLAYHLDNAHALKIILKESPKYYPIFGPGMMFFNFIFLKRNWNQDRHVLEKSLKRFTEHPDESLMLLLFPEGTILTYGTIETCEKYAEKSGEVRPPGVLIPRTTGLHAVLNTLATDPSITHIYSMTLGFSGVRMPVLPWELYTPMGAYAHGVAPSTVYMHLERFPLADVPFQDRDVFGKWLLDKYRVKGERVQHLLDTGKWTPSEEARAFERSIKIRDSAAGTPPPRVIRIPIGFHHWPWSLTMCWTVFFACCGMIHYARGAWA